MVSFNDVCPISEKDMCYTEEKGKFAASLVLVPFFAREPVMEAMKFAKFYRAFGETKEEARNNLIDSLIEDFNKLR